ncbi:MAG: STAS/SEC14 domain-containing protein [Weeksellaceae bacterium]
MITKLDTSFTNIVSFEFTDKIYKEDFETTVFPAIKDLKEKQDEINMVYIINTDLKNFTTEAWLQDALLGLKNLTKFNRVAIVTASDNVQTFTELFSKVIPGEFKGFEMSEREKAMKWVANG